ncbi:serine/threonine-protein kinase DCLK3 [Genypterus blacodes]|uniref:serine/threonine-protein kinase DCLK3 n=1 Tax=Genypterus blacodes TaxID=154954 RepID=UPI003F760381
MTPSWRARQGCANLRHAPHPAPSVKRPGCAPQLWPARPHHGRVNRNQCLPPPVFHTRHAEESAERPRLVTVVRPCGQSALRKVTILLNRRGVVSFDQLLLDISEALGFPRWHRARVTRLYTPCAREVRGVCDFFCGEVAFLALGKSRPELGGVQEALEELFPEHFQYRAEALRVWEKKLRPAPDKATKGDSGYSEGTDSSGTDTNQDANVKTHSNTHRIAQHTETQQPESHNSDTKQCHKRNACRKPVHPPNHLQRLHLRGGAKEQQPSVIGPFKPEEGLREEDVPSPALCENCLGRRAKHQLSKRTNPIPGRVPLPPLSRKQKGSSPTNQEVTNPQILISSPPPPPISRSEDKCQPQIQLLHPLPDIRPVHRETEQAVTFDLPVDGSDVTLSDIERCYDIGRVVGDGNFAVVRESRRRDNGQTLALKIIERSKLIGREHMMQNELSLLGSLRHPRVVRLLAHHHTPTHSYLVMEFVSGGDLFEAIAERGKFPEAEAGLMVSDVSEALSFIHSRSIVHRDLKPENLLIEHVADSSWRLKLGDFGLAMVVTEPVFTICGTPTYVAPEILAETGYGVAVDVWALGVILYILLCGFPPFRSRDRDQEELFQLIKQAQLHFLSPYWDPISEDAKGLVRALLQPDPSVRLTAEQALLHPWVKAMASICRQGALKHKAQMNPADLGREPVRMKTPTLTNAAETPTHEEVGHVNGKGALIDQAELRRRNERQSELNTGPVQARDEDKPAQMEAHTQSDTRSVHQKSQPPSADSGSHSSELGRQPIQSQDPPMSNTDCSPVALTSPPAQLSANANQTDLVPRITTDQSKENNPLKSPPASPTPQTNKTTPNASSTQLETSTNSGPD